MGEYTFSLLDIDYILEGKKQGLNYFAYTEATDYFSNASRIIFYGGAEKPFRVDFKLQKINDEFQKQLLIPLVVKIQNIAKNRDDQARIAISLVQKIPFGESNKSVLFAEDKEARYSRYPYEVIYDRMGVCGEKSELLAFLLRELGFGTAMFYYQNENFLN